MESKKGETKMSNNCTNRLIVVGLKGRPTDFARELELAMYGTQLRSDNYHYVKSFSDRIEG
jgi:hypothetical protein